MPDILILGASSDIAAATAFEFAANGYTTWLAGRNIELLQAQANDINIRYNTSSYILPFDANNIAEHKAFVGSLKVIPDVVLVAFGYLGDQQVAEDNWSESEKIITTNFTSTVSILNELVKVMPKNNTCVIAGISSVAGNRGRKSNYIYGSAKAGFTAYLSGLRNKFFNQIHVVTVLPGFVDTKMTHHLTLPPALTAKPNKVAKEIYKAVVHKKNIVYVKPVWRYIMFTISHIPEFIYKKLSIG